MELVRLPLFGNGSLREALVVRDPLRRNGMRHSGRALLAAAICAMLSGHRSFRAIAEWIQDQPERAATSRLQSLGTTGRKHHPQIIATDRR